MATTSILGSYILSEDEIYTYCPPPFLGMANYPDLAGGHILSLIYLDADMYKKPRPGQQNLAWRLLWELLGKRSCLTRTG